MYALLDWDNSLRKKVTLFRWEDFLVQKGALSSRVISEREKYRLAHLEGRMDHDQLSRECCLSFLRAAEGLTFAQYSELLEEYLPHDREDFAAYTPVLFDWLHTHGIEPVVVSGAPRDIIGRYFDEFGIRRAWAFDYEFRDGRLSSDFLGSGGHDKRAAVEACRREFGCDPILALGDSASDLPMLKAAQCPLIAGNPSPLSKLLPNAVALDYDQRGAQALQKRLDELSTIISLGGNS